MKLAEAFVSIKLQAAGFMSGLRRAERHTERSSRRIGRSFDQMSQRLTRTFARLGATLVAAFGFAALIKGIRSLNEELDRLAKRAKTIGVSPEQLAGLGFAASQTTGLTSRQAQVSLERFSKRVGEAATGSGEGASVLKALGLDNAGFTSDSLAGKIDQLGAALSQVTDRGLKLTFVQKLLGDEARQILPLLEMSRVQRQGLIDEHSRLRGNISAAAASAERQADALEKMNEAFKRLGQTIILRVEPALVGMASALTDSIQAYVRPGGLEAFFDSFGELFGDAGSIRRNLKRAEDAINKSAGRIGGISAGGSGDSSSGSGILRAQGRLGLNTMLGTFNVPNQSVLATLRNIAQTNRQIAEHLARSRGVPLT